MIADSMRSKFESHSHKDDDNETMDLNDPKMVAKLRQMADAQYRKH